MQNYEQEIVKLEQDIRDTEYALSICTNAIECSELEERLLMLNKKLSDLLHKRKKRR